MLFEEQFTTDVLYRFVEFDANHKSASAHLLDAINFLQFFKEIIAHLVYIVEQVIGLHYIKHSLNGRTSQMITAEGSSKLAIYSLEFGTDEHHANRKAVTDSLSLSNNIGFYTSPLVGKEFSTASTTTLYFVKDKSCTCAVAQLLQLLQEQLRRNLHTTYTLYAFDDDSCHVALLNLGTYSLNVAHGNIGRVSVSIDWSNNLWVVGNLNGKRCTAVESLLKGNYTAFSILE